MFRAQVIFALAAAALCAWTAPAFADPPANFDARVEEIRQAVGVPGMAVTVVEDGRITVANGYGVRRLGGAERADGNTLFPLGSVSKAFTAAALAVLVDRQEIAWDDPVIDHIRGFQMYDPWVTREITVRDLLVHRSGLGLGAGDLLAIPRTSRSRADVVHALRHIRPATSFRSGYAYDNILYIAAGQLIEEVSGQTWEHFVRDQLLRPAGMRNSTTDLESRRAVRNRASLHGRRDGPMIGMGTQEVLDENRVELGAVGAPAGAIWSSAADVGRWIQIQLARGALPDGSGRLFSEAASREMWRPQVPMGTGQLPEPVSAASAQFSAYALGWEVRDYRGHKVVMHSGAVFGGQSVLILLPERNVGVAVMINSEDGEAVLGVAYEVLDHYLGVPHYDWGGAWRQFVAMRDQRAVAMLQSASTTRAQIGPSLPLERYVGNFNDAWYGPMSITLDNNRLVMDFKMTPGMIGDMTHWQYDTFRVDWRDSLIEPAFVTFSLDANGGVERIAMNPVSPLADFSFDYQDLDFRPVAAAAR